MNFNPRSPHGERQPQFIIDSYVEIFQSTLPAWGATNALNDILYIYHRISIHAPRMGSDIILTCLHIKRRNFNPRSPHGERPARNYAEAWRIEFQSTLPAWGATPASPRPTSSRPISIHAPRMGSDLPLNTVSLNLS